MDQRPITLTSIEDVVAAVPHLMHLHPSESLVVVPVDAQPSPLIRLDIPGDEIDQQRLRHRLSDLSHYFAGQRIMILSYTDNPAQAWEASTTVQDAFRDSRVIADVLIHTDGWIDRDGTTGRVEPATRTRIAAEFAFAGLAAPAASIDEIYDSFTPSATGLDPAAIAAHHRLTDRILTDPTIAREELRWTIGVVAAHAATQNPLPDEIAARTVALLHTTLIRDFTLETITPDNAAGHAAILKDLTIRTPEQHRSPIATATGFAYWMAGDPLTARAALHQVPDPDYVLANLLHLAMNTGIRPKAMVLSQPLTETPDPSRTDVRHLSPAPEPTPPVTGGGRTHEDRTPPDPGSGELPPAISW